MNFASFTFLFAFLPAFLGLYYFAHALRVEIRILNGLTLAWSLLFYAWGAPDFIPFLLATCWLDYFASRRLAGLPLNDSRRGPLLGAAVVLNAGVLLYFKYSNFFVEQMNHALGLFGAGSLNWSAVVLPIGISFITFEKLSYLIDVYRGRTEPAPTFGTYLLFISLFPHLIAGPIFRYHDLADQFLHRRHSMDDLFHGIVRFCFGLAKKILIADTLAFCADRAFALPPEQLGAASAWFGILCYTFQIYFDFSGYSDMAIGLGRMIGFRFNENFHNPYVAESITDFWRRWHISLSNWLREYLYIPLGGSRGSPRRTYANLWIVFLVSGFWHGANWTFLCWGSYHGVFLVLERIGFARILERSPRPLRILYSFAVVLFGWVLFRAKSISHALLYFQCLFTGWRVVEVPTIWLRFDVTPRTWFMFAVAVAMSFLPAFSLPATGREGRPKFWLRTRQCALGVGALVLFVVAAGSLANSAFHPFIYFQF